MDKALIERLAREAGMDPPTEPFLRWSADEGALRRFAALVAEECAKLCDTAANDPFANEGCVDSACSALAAAIRAKFKEPA